MSWLDDISKHWKLSLALSWSLSLGGAAMCGRATAPKPPPAVHYTEHDDYEGTRNNDVRVERVEGPVVIKEHIVTRTVPGPAIPGTTASCGTETVTDREESHGQVTTDTTDKSTSTEKAHVDTELRITPVAPDKPGWSVGVSLENPVTDKLLHLGVGRRLMGNMWIQAGTTPARGEWDVGLAYQF
jgi:hypothetical protein